MDKEIKIEITGPCNTGKSLILYLVKDLLMEHGFEVEHTHIQDHDDEIDFDNKVSRNIEIKVDSVKLKTGVSIMEKNIRYEN